jgi:hypothetical protein
VTVLVLCRAHVRNQKIGSNHKTLGVGAGHTPANGAN